MNDRSPSRKYVEIVLTVIVVPTLRSQSTKRTLVRVFALHISRDDFGGLCTYVGHASRVGRVHGVCHRKKLQA